MEAWSQADLEAARRRLLEALRREIRDERVLQAMEKVRRDLFVPASSRHLAYEDMPLPIGFGQTISQPFIVALMSQSLDLTPTDNVLEIGTGSGYQTAILAELAARVITMERLPALAYAARALLESLGYGGRIAVRVAGEALGCPEEAPFNAIVVTAGSPKVPRELQEQLAPGGRLVIPVGSLQEQDLVKLTRTSEGFSFKSLGPCRFVPLIGRSAWEGPAASETP
ncbi:MAG: protein-L-isoaspartate(D-aspartate) O-methyltransferase [Chloroflexi bacterium]|nr:protein-L-isoaspartate(D-aspartate) O-methyltransferase [Chloroflexota bacterium]